MKAFVVIGYAFGDKEVKEAIAEGLYMEQKAIMVVIDPNATIEKISEEFPEVQRERLKVIPKRFCQDGTISDLENQLGPVFSN